MSRKILPVPALMVLSPLIAEYVLGNLPTDKLYYLPVLCLMYGGGAVFVRELSRYINRGWLPFVFLAAAYGLMEEGLVTQSIFNPDYMHLKLLKYGFIPSLHTALPWAIYAVSIHVIWSLAVPVGLVDALFPARRNEPWLGMPGLVVTGLLFIGGSTWLGLASVRQNGGFIAPSPELLTAAAVIAVLVICAFWTPGLPDLAKSMPRRLQFSTLSHLVYSRSCADRLFSWPTRAGIPFGIGRGHRPLQ